ncbi:MAG: hypothetical protein O7C58_05345 [Rickettsia endosymbiont of Ixodes persulcatus]|nr:hypothetical protein [Rickettsia endosymbiont of Ixodes persulcatus]MCZ6903456.1 hypothetical protein [Rickettsia endosymbiont of Ixodes persulcatus]MCZ6909494.1 hypothetical protein [Rickettsia endosymbiont of Ixodes persulcatus]MCZ6909716.1 hypothetical protein [Rickettsia endosymbiont of Ixodes persulcatus]
MFGGEPLNPLKAAAETYIKWYEENFNIEVNPNPVVVVNPEIDVVAAGTIFEDSSSDLD